ncbi:Gfo/Idh/MocA family protein [Rahnella variigena]|jgi:predicted dehydrogenase|uniref:Gfo/Idh/MocA family protein n=1 Tax=Rahnella variigena TaxID=574964 RepID=UPI00132F650F|nr:Gfo/Idh/MocA family oxidoreductase [Rahnella variigena]
MLKIAIIGTGNISHNHIQGYLEFADRCQIVALVDIYPEKAEEKKRHYGLTNAKVYASHEEILGDTEIDVFDVCTPPYVHAEISINALNAGKHVLCEKPMAASLQECDAMISAAKESGKTLSIIAQNRFTDAFWRLKKVLDSGETGKVCHAQVDSFWWRGHSYYDLWWRGTWEKEAGGCTLNHAVHHIDAIQWMLGFPSEVVSMITNAAHDNAEVEDLSAAIFKYDTGALTQLTASVVHHGEDQKIVIQGEKARISAPWDKYASISAPNGFPIDERDTDRENQLEDIYQSIPKLTYTLHIGQIDNFLTALETGTAPLIDGVQGKRSLELIAAIYKSAITRSIVTLPLASTDPFYQIGGLVSLAPHFYEKSASVENFANEDAIPLGKNMDKGA